MSYINITFDKYTYTSKTIGINEFNLSVPGKELFVNSRLSMSPGSKYGLIGPNGSGKSSLLKTLVDLRNETRTHGFKISTLYVEQEIELDHRSPVEFILDSNHKKRFFESELERINQLIESDEFETLDLNESECLQLKADELTQLPDYLNDWNHTAIIISHNIGFLNDVCDYIFNIEEKKLVSYKGNYSMFKMAFEAKMREAEKDWEKYDKKLKDMKKRGAEKTKVEDYIKANEVKKPEKKNIVSLKFKDLPMIRSSIISLNNVSFGYDESRELLSNVSLGIGMDSKVVLVGPNGSGKSTLIKLLVGEIQPTSGDISINSHCRIGYYNQHFENQLPLDQTPIEYLRSIIPDTCIINGAVEQSVRCYLGQVKLETSNHNKKISELSGGQKARVAILKLVFQQPHCLILDEPTNHLDIETVESLINALSDFKGGILVITHEPELIEKIDARLWVMDPETKNINTQIDSYQDYCKYILKQ